MALLPAVFLLNIGEDLAESVFHFFLTEEGIEDGVEGGLFFFIELFDEMKFFHECFIDEFDIFKSLDSTKDYKERIAYDGNGNILKYRRNGFNNTGGSDLAMDSLGYKYIAGTNQLDHITTMAPIGYRMMISKTSPITTMHMIPLEI